MSRKANRWVTQLHLLTSEQLSELKEALLNAGLAYELGGDWRAVFRSYKHKYQVGYIHRLYRTLETLKDLPDSSLEAMSAHFTPTPMEILDDSQH